jgi:hypothetical protein
LPVSRRTAKKVDTTIKTLLAIAVHYICSSQRSRVTENGPTLVEDVAWPDTPASSFGLALRRAANDESWPQHDSGDSTGGD